MENKTDTLRRTIQVHWRSFAPIWLFPLIYYGSWVATERFGYSGLVFWVVDMPYFFWSFFRTTKLWMRREVKYSHYTFLAMVVPFVIWVILVYSNISFFGASRSQTTIAPYVSTSAFSVSVVKFAFFVVSFAIQGWMIPCSLFFIFKNKSIESFICFAASLTIGISSFIVLTVLPDQDHNLRLTDFNKGYLKVTHDVNPFFITVLAGFSLYLFACLLKGMRFGISYYKLKRQP